MYYKKKKKKYIKNNYKNFTVVKGQNYAIDSEGKKHFWLKKRVSKKQFRILKLKFTVVHQPWLWKKKKDSRIFLGLAKTVYFFKNFLFFLSLKKCKKNIFANFFNIKGDVIYKASSGFFHKRSLRKTFFATGFLLKKMQNSIVIRKLFLNFKKKAPKKTFFFLNIIGSNYQRGFKKNLKDFIKKGSSKFYKITEIKCKAHNGVRKSKRRRK